jgi:hypothetical protein
MVDEENLNPHGVAVGQRWKECDKRMAERTVEVIEIVDKYAFVKNVQTGKKSRIALKNFRPNSRGYVKIEGIISNHAGPMS